MTTAHGYEIEDLRVFRGGRASCGSFTGRGRRRLHYTQSGVSRRIAALERATRRLRCSSAMPAGVPADPGRGWSSTGHAVDILGRLDAAVGRRSRPSARGSGRTVAHRVVRHGQRASSCPTVLAELPPHRGPEVETTVAEELTRRSGDRPGSRAGDLDVAVVSDYPERPAAGGRVSSSMHLCDDPLLVALPPGHRLAGAAAVDLADLADESWIEAGRLAADGATVHAAAAARAGFVPRTDITVPGWTAKQGFVAAGLGVTLVPRLAAAGHAAATSSSAPSATRRRSPAGAPSPAPAAPALGEVAPVAADHFGAAGPRTAVAPG